MAKGAPQVIVLAGGEGKRFAPFVTNKTLFPFLGEPLLVHQLRQLARVGIERVVVACNPDTLTFIQEIHIPSLEITCVVQPEATGMADAVLALTEYLKDGPCICMNAVDVVGDELFTAVLTAIKTKSPATLVVGKQVDRHFPAGYLKLDGEQVVGVVEKPAPGSEPSEFINLVYHYFARPQEFLAELTKARQVASTDDVYERALTSYLSNNSCLCVPYSGYWHKLKYPHFVLDVMDIFLQNRVFAHTSATAKVAPQAVIEGAVYIDDGAVIQAGAVIQGPAYIGKNAVVGIGSLVRQSCIEAGAVIGYGSEVARSYIGPQCMLHHNFIGDSVLEKAVNPSYGTVTTNYRFDAQPVQIHLPDGTKLATERQKLGACIAAEVFSGAHTVFLPGVTVGENARIYPTSVVHGHVPARATLKSKQTQEVVLDSSGT